MRGDDWWERCAWGLLVAAGGTGGHLYPAIAVADRARERSKGVEVTFVGTERGLESRIVPKAGFPLFFVRARPLRGGRLASKIKAVFGLFSGLLDAWRLLGRVRPRVVMGVGAYVSWAVVFTAALKRVPTLILEPNAEPGLANRWLGPFVDEAACAWEETTRYFGKKGVLTGNPVRKEILLVPALGPQSDRMRVLVFGGSQGSRALNRAMKGAVPRLAPVGGRLSVLHQTGPEDVDAVREAYAEGGIVARVTPYIEAMDEAYAASDLVVCRAGATTTAELAAAGRPALLVPLGLAGGHQARNAEMMERAGAARFLRESELTPERLAAELMQLLDHPRDREEMAAKARALAVPDAAGKVVERLLRLASPEKEPAS